jgi:NTE family protein
VEARKQKPFQIQFGGNISNRPISTGFAGVSYQNFKRRGWELSANTYFGRFYNSGFGKAKVRFPGKRPFELFIEGGRNLWNFFTSKSFFFEDQKPSYLVQSENSVFGGIVFPLSIHDKFSASYGFAYQADDYYQTKAFTSKDTPDKTELSINTFDFKYEYNTLNRIQYANQGLRFCMRATYSLGDEISRPGSTSPLTVKTVGKFHEWWNLNSSLDAYYLRTKPFKLGLYAEANYSTQTLFANYTASILKTPAFKPTPESKTLFLESFHKYDFLGAGHKVVFTFLKDFDLRIEAYAMQAYREVIKLDDGTHKMAYNSDLIYGILMGAMVYNSPVGPVSFSANYYSNVPEVIPEDKTPITFLFHFGYVIFNRSSVDGYKD